MTKLLPKQSLLGLNGLGWFV